MFFVRTITVIAYSSLRDQSDLLFVTSGFNRSGWAISDH